MWVRSAFWVGAPKAGETERFKRTIDRDIVPGLQRLPGVRDAHALWPQRREDQPPEIACQILVHFADRAGVDEMLASPERRAMRAEVVQLAALFEGTISHIDYEVGATPVPQPTGERV